jgi:hypothetical protein
LGHRWRGARDPLGSRWWGDLGCYLKQDPDSNPKHEYEQHECVPDHKQRVTNPHVIFANADADQDVIDANAHEDIVYTDRTAGLAYAACARLR